MLWNCCTGFIQQFVATDQDLNCEKMKWVNSDVRSSDAQSLKSQEWGWSSSEGGRLMKGFLAFRGARWLLLELNFMYKRYWGFPPTLRSIEDERGVMVQQPKVESPLLNRRQTLQQMNN